MIRHYYAIAERGGGRTWWISFPGGTAYSSADDAADIVPQAQDALASLCIYPPVTGMPPAIEDGAPLPTDPSGYEAPAMVVVIPFEQAAEAKAAA